MKERPVLGVWTLGGHSYLRLCRGHGEARRLPEQGRKDRRNQRKVAGRPLQAEDLPGRDQGHLGSTERWQ